MFLCLSFFSFSIWLFRVNLQEWCSLGSFVEGKWTLLLLQNTFIVFSICNQRGKILLVWFGRVGWMTCWNFPLGLYFRVSFTKMLNSTAVCQISSKWQWTLWLKGLGVVEKSCLNPSWPPSEPCSSLVPHGVPGCLILYYSYELVQLVASLLHFDFLLSKKGHEKIQTLPNVIFACLNVL